MYPRAFRERAVERMKTSKNVKALAKELGVHRTVLYQWRDQLGAATGSERRQRAEESALERENRELKEALAEKMLEVDFFKSALQKVEARRQSNKPAGETASTNKCAK